MSQAIPSLESAPASAPQTGWGFRAAVAAALVLSVAASGFFYVKVRRAGTPRGALDQTLGVQRVHGVEESGFHNTEVSESTGEPFRWTDGSARLTVLAPAAPPAALHVRLGLAVPNPTRLCVRVNGSPVVDETLKPQPEWARTFDLTGLAAGEPVTVELLSDSFVPSRVTPGSTDDRVLGVCVRGVTLVSRDRNYVGVVLGAEPVPGVEESGFHGVERGGQPCRWTDGRAKLLVPIPPGTRPRALVVSAEIPNRKDFRVRVMVNGRAVFDDAVPPKTVWAKELPLDGIELAGRAEIELVSPSVAPAQTEPGSKDTRQLGMRVRKVVLIGD